MNPQDPCVSADVHLLDIIVDYLRHALAYGSSPLAGLLSELFQKMRDVAEAFVNQTHLVHPSAAEDPREESNLHLNKSSSEAPFSEEDTSLAALQRQVNDHLQVHQLLIVFCCPFLLGLPSPRRLSVVLARI
jgi:hypothetical protein